MAALAVAHPASEIVARCPLSDLSLDFEHALNVNRLPIHCDVIHGEVKTAVSTTLLLAYDVILHTMHRDANRI